MPETSYFALPLPLWQQPLSYRTAKYERLKQRGRYRGIHDDEKSEELEHGHESEVDVQVGRDIQADEGGWEHESRSRSPLILSPDEAHQYRISGLPNYCELPGGKFPHKAPLDDAVSLDSGDQSNDDKGGVSTTISKLRKKKKGKIINNRQRIEKELSRLNPPLYLAGGNPTKKNTLRLHHLNIITAVLHRCLMEGDYLRAGRAWGLILRDNFGGHPADVRNAGRWAVGAEILLWKDQCQAEPGEEGDGSGKVGETREWFSRIGFERAKEYFERMIIQYQYRKIAPNALGPLDFYPAMFGLWVSIIQEESKRAREDAELASSLDGSIAGGDDLYDPMSINDVLDEQRSTKYGKKEGHIAARIKELEEALQISTQMDELLVSPPYSDSHELLRLRGMISLWIGDLHISSVTADIDEDNISDDGSKYGDAGVRLESAMLKMEIGSAKEKRETELEKAKSFFEKARARQSRIQGPGG